MNVLDFEKMKREGQKITMVTAYDAWGARLLDASPVHCLLVGDSVSMVVHGYPSTVHATVEMMATHTAMVARGLNPAHGKFLIADMPFLSFRKGESVALDAVEQLMRAGAHAVKLEGVWGHEAVVSRIVESGVPVMGHIGLTPQSVNALGGFKVQGKNDEQARDLIEQARELEKLGCFALVLECVPARLAREITQAIAIPTIGIGAGVDVDGQVLVFQDMLGLGGDFKPKFLRRYLDGGAQMQDAFARYCKDVQERRFPSEEESYS